MKQKNNGAGGSPPTLNSVQAGQDTGATFWSRMGRLPLENPAKEAFIREMAKGGWSRAKAEERWNVYGLNENIAQGVARAMAAHGVLEEPESHSHRHVPLGRRSGPGRINWKIRRSWQMGGNSSARRAISGAPI